MVYLLHFDKPIGHIRHWAGATSDVQLATQLGRGDASRLQVPIVVAARELGIDVIVARTWSSVYERVDDLPHGDARRKLCTVCLEAARERRSV
jgi:hypothetical protein